MKLSQFKKSTIKKVLKFGNSGVETSVIEDNQELQGEVNFYKMNAQKLDEIHAELNKMDNSEDNYLMYKLIPHISDLECDVTYNEFQDMLSDPTSSFISLLEELMNVVRVDLFSTIEEVYEVAKTINTQISTNEEVTPQPNEEVNVDAKIENNKSVGADLDSEVLIESLYDQLSKTKNRDERKKIIDRITMLQS